MISSSGSSAGAPLSSSSKLEFERALCQPYFDLAMSLRSELSIEEEQPTIITWTS